MLNRLLNINMKYEILHDMHTIEQVKMNGMEMTLRKALSMVNVNGVAIFQAIEQGYGNKGNNTFLYYHPEHKQLVLKWFNE